MPPKPPPNSNPGLRRLNTDQRTIQDAANLYPQPPQDPATSPALTARAQRLANRNRTRNGEPTVPIVRPEGEITRAPKPQGRTNKNTAIGARPRPRQRPASALRKSLTRAKRKIVVDSTEESSDGNEEGREKQRKRPRTGEAVDVYSPSDDSEESDGSEGGDDGEGEAGKGGRKGKGEGKGKGKGEREKQKKRPRMQGKGKGKVADVYKPSSDSENSSDSEGGNNDDDDDEGEVEAGKGKVNGKGKGKVPEKGKGKVAGKSSDLNYKPLAASDSDSNSDNLSDPATSIPASTQDNANLQKKVGQSSTSSAHSPTARRTRARPTANSSSSSSGSPDPQSSVLTGILSILGSDPNSASSSLGLPDPAAPTKSLTHLKATRVTGSSSNLGPSDPPMSSPTRPQTDGKSGEWQKSGRRKVRKEENLYKRMVGKPVVNGTK